MCIQHHDLFKQYLLRLVSQVEVEGLFLVILLHPVSKMLGLTLHAILAKGFLGTNEGCAISSSTVF